MEISVDLSVLLNKRQWDKALPELPEKLRAAGVKPQDIALELVSNACMKEHVLIDEYMMNNPGPVPGEVYRVLINGSTDLPLPQVASTVAKVLPIDGYWIGSAELGHTELGLGTGLEFCRW